jgi:PAS domain S-box-containing protein
LSTRVPIHATASARPRVTQSVVVAEAPSGRILFSTVAPAEVVGRRLSELAELDDLAMFRPDGRRYAPGEWMLARSIASGEVIRDEEFFKFAADGSRCAYRTSSYPVHDARGRVIAAVAVASDVAGERQFDTERAYHATLLRNVEDAVVGTDPDFRLTVWNRGAERLYGYAAAEVLGRPAREVASYAGDLSRHALERELLETDRTRTEITAFRKDGTPIDVELVTAAVRDADGAITGYLGIHRDMTEHKRVAGEQAGRAHQQRLVAALGLHALADGELQGVLDGAVTVVAEGIGVTPVGIAELVPGSDALLLRAGMGWEQGAVGLARGSAGRHSLVGYAVTTGEPVVSVDIDADPRFECSPFLRSYAATSAAVVVIAGRRGPFGALGVFSRTRRSFSADDVNFLQSVANVVSAAVERAWAESLLDDVREAERRRLARDLHDDALQGLTLALQQATAMEGAAGLAPMLKRAGEQVRAAIYDLRLDAEDPRPIRERLEALVEVQRDFAADVRIELDVARNVPSDGLGSVGTQLLRAVGEAVVNARRHSGGRTITVAVWRQGDALRAEVSDDGSGFAGDAEPPAGATGIKGMRERAELVRGELAIRSSPAGTKVRFSVPVGTAATTVADDVRVLLVEDHAAVREAIAAMFDRAPGFAVVGEAASMAEARPLLPDADVAVIDLGLPDGFGGELIRELREINPRAQALVLSAGLDRREIARAVESGAAGTLDKTASLDEVVDAVRRLRAGERLVPLEEVVDLLRLAARDRDREREDRRIVASISPREHEVLQLLADGLSSDEIAERLHIALRTERNHVANILTKLGVHSRLQAVVFALRHGIIVLG